MTRPSRLSLTMPSPRASAAVGKTAQLVRLLSRKCPPTVAQIAAAMGWQPHSARAAISRLRRAGVVVATERSASGQTTYRIVDGGCP